jgi:hypothetical protein
MRKLLWPRGDLTKSYLGTEGGAIKQGLQLSIHPFVFFFSFLCFGNKTEERNGEDAIKGKE